MSRFPVKRAFTLVEVAIAVTVMGIAVVALAVLISSSLDRREESEAEMRAAEFASSVFNGLRAESLASAGSNKWDNYWSCIRSGSTWLIADAADLVWTNPPVFYGDGRLYTNVFTNYALHAESATDVVDRAFRYSLEVTPGAGAHTRRVEAVLRVWHGKHGNTNNESPLLFYTEYADPGDL
ncbi:MAG: type II secretion system protein [Kiritimatiellia bacterium]